MKRMFQMLVSAGLLAASAMQATQVKIENLRHRQLQKPLKRPGSKRAGKHTTTPHYLNAKGQRESLRAFRRAQGGPGIELVNGVWQPRA